VHGVLDTAEDTIRNVDNAAADIQSVLGLTTNGGPGGPLSDSPQSPAKPGGSSRVEVTPIGAVTRFDK